MFIINIPFYKAGTDVELTWKLLEIPAPDPKILASDSDPNTCEKVFKIDDLWKGGKDNGKETLACLKIPAQVKACDNLSTKAKKKIIGCN